VLFFVFPRGLLDLSAALGRSRFGETGIDNTLDPGSIAKVALSSEVAFRVRFPDGGPPPNAARYWRCITMWHCEGLRWTRGERLGYLPLLSPKPSARRPAADHRSGGARPDLDARARSAAESARCRRHSLVPEFDDAGLTHAGAQFGAHRGRESTLRTAARRRVICRSHHREAALQLPERISPRLKQLTDYWESVAQNDEQIVQLA
jgi:hypothetical protein